ncbi:MAG: DUF5011 domain-containing protein [Clostridium sp.]|nr:DUF5011 domain-containing protein [Clostridium sp.]
MKNSKKNVSMIVGAAIIGNQVPSLVSAINYIDVENNENSEKDSATTKAETIKKAKIHSNVEYTKSKLDSLVTPENGEKETTTSETSSTQPQTDDVTWLDEYVADKLGKDVENLEYNDYSQITELVINNNPNITTIPLDIYKCKNLVKIDLSNNSLYDISNLINIPDSLTTLDLSGNYIIKLPNSIKNKASLRNVNFSDNQIAMSSKSIKEILDTIPNATVNLDKNLINDKTYTPNPKRLTYPETTQVVKLGKKVNFEKIYATAKIDDTEPISPAYVGKVMFAYSYYVSDGNPIDDNGIAVKLGKIEGKLELNVLGVYDNPLLEGTNKYILDVVEGGNDAPVIKVDDIVIYEGQTFDPLKYVTVEDEDIDILDRLEYTTDVNENVPGEYSVTYKATDSEGEITTKKVKVTVKEDLAPVINAQDIAVSLNVTSMDDITSRFTAYDEVDGDVTKNMQFNTSAIILGREGVYDLTMSVSDSKQQTSTKTVKVTIREDVAPVILATNITIVQGLDFDPLSYAIAIDYEDEDVTDNITVVSNNVNPNQPGVYEVVYQVKDSAGNTVQLKVNVTVQAPVGEAPVISATDKQIPLGSDFDPLEGVIATDKEDGTLKTIKEREMSQEDIIGKLQGTLYVVENTVDTTKAGEYKVTYRAEDTDSNFTEKTIKVTVDNGTAPTISASDKEVLLNSTFNPLQGVKASDKEDGDITKDIVVKSNDVDTKKLGEYTVVYEVKDSSGNTTTRPIQVKVVEKLTSNNSSNNGTTGSNNSSNGTTGGGTTTEKPQTGDVSLVPHLGLVVASAVSLLSINKKKEEEE